MKGYNNLKKELNKIWDMLVLVIPAKECAFGTTPKKLKQWLSDIGTETRRVELQKTTILHCYYCYCCYCFYYTILHHYYFINLGFCTGKSYTDF